MENSLETPDPLGGVARPDGGTASAAPAVPLIIAALAVAVGCLLFLGSSLTIHAIGYAAGSIVAFGAVAMYRRLALGRQFVTGVVVPGALDAAAVGVLLAGFVVALGHAWFVARHFA